MRYFATIITAAIATDDIDDPRGPRWWVTCTHHEPSLYLTAVGPHHAGVPQPPEETRR